MSVRTLVSRASVGEEGEETQTSTYHDCMVVWGNVLFEIMCRRRIFFYSKRDKEYNFGGARYKTVKLYISILQCTAVARIDRSCTVFAA